MSDPKPSKSARKREQLALQKLGEQMISLSDEELAAAPIDARLRDVLQVARGMRSHGALRRQKQLIGRLMRDADADAIRSWLVARTADDLQAKRLFARAEMWRDRLVKEGVRALDEFLAEHDHADTEIRARLVELDQTFDERREKTLKREIFRHVHAALTAARR